MCAPIADPRVKTTPSYRGQGYDLVAISRGYAQPPNTGSGFIYREGSKRLGLPPLDLLQDYGVYSKHPRRWAGVTSLSWGRAMTVVHEARAVYQSIDKIKESIPAKGLGPVRFVGEKI